MMDIWSNVKGFTHCQLDDGGKSHWQLAWSPSPAWWVKYWRPSHGTCQRNLRDDMFCENNRACGRWQLVGIKTNKSKQLTWKNIVVRHELRCSAIAVASSPNQSGTHTWRRWCPPRHHWWSLVKVWTDIRIALQQIWISNLRKFSFGSSSSSRRYFCRRVDLCRGGRHDLLMKLLNGMKIEKYTLEIKTMQRRLIAVFSRSIRGKVNVTSQQCTSEWKEDVLDINIIRKKVHTWLTSLPHHDRHSLLERIMGGWQQVRHNNEMAKLFKLQLLFKQATQTLNILR